MEIERAVESLTALDKSPVNATKGGSPLQPDRRYQEFQQELCLFLQSKGKYMAASNVVEFTQDPKVQKKAATWPSG